MDEVDMLCRTRRLRALLADRRREPAMFAPASAEAIAEAQAIGPDLATFAVATMLEGYVEGGDPATHERAVDLASCLRLDGAVPALVGCLERLSEFDSVAHAALRALEPMRQIATPLLLAAFRRCTTPEDRTRLASALAQIGARGAGAREAYVSLLADDPRNAAGMLAELHDRAALPPLLATLDRLALDAGGTDELDRLETIVAVGQAVRTLRGSFTLAQRHKLEEAWSRSEALLLGDPAASPR